MTEEPSALVYYYLGEDLMCVRHPLLPGDTIRTFLKRHGFAMGRVSLKKNGKKARSSERVSDGDEILHRHL